MAELAGVMVGNYFLLECLGREGMVETYRARPTTRGGYDVLLRIYRPTFPDPSNFQEHFAAEVEKVWRCHHEHIQPLIEYGAGDDLLYSVTPLSEAETLAQFLERWQLEQQDKPLPLPLVAQIITQLSSALQYAHEHQIVHGNVQPSSMLVESETQFLLTNFSMQHSHQESDAVVAQVQEGDAAYSAPEQAVGMLSLASDIYALGVLTFRLLTGRLPYDGGSADEIALKHANEPIPSLREWRPDLAEGVELVVRVALAKSPTARFPSVVAFVDALLTAIRGEQPPLVVATPSTPLTPTRRIPVRRRRTITTWSRVFTLLSILVMLSALSGIVLFFAASPFHLDSLSFFPFRNTVQPGGFHTNPTVGVTPSPAVNPVTTVTPQSFVNKENAPTSPGHTTPTVRGTHSPTATTRPTGTTPSLPVCVPGTLSIDGSLYLEPAMQQINSDYTAMCAGLQIGLRGDGNRAINMVQTGHIDIADADQSARPARNLTDHPFAALLYSLITSPDITLAGLSSAQIQSIFQGQFTNWSQLGGPNEAITVILPPTSSAISAVFRTFVLRGSPLKASAFVFKKDQPGRVAQVVSAIRGAISFVPLITATSSTSPIHTLSIDGASASAQSLRSGTYPFWSVEHLYTLGNGTTQAQSYIQFATSPGEMTLLSYYGASPLNGIDPAVLQSHLPGPQF